VAAALAACGGVEASAPAMASQRVPGALQLQSASALPASLSARAKSGNATWSPPLDPTESRLLVPAEVIEVRDTVRVGEAVTIVVNTIGENGCWQADGGTLVQHADSAVISVFDRHSGAQVCTMIWTDRLTHAFTTTFPQAGTGFIRASGRRIKDSDPTYQTPVTAERAIVVIP